VIARRLSMGRTTASAAVTVVCDVPHERVDPLARTLGAMAADTAGNAGIPFERLRNVHFARLFLTEPARPQLVYMSDVDGTAEEHLEDLVEVAGSGLDTVFGHCAGWPTGAGVGGRERLAYLSRRNLPPAAAYVNTVGRTLTQIVEERRLRDAIEGFLDRARDALPSDPLRLREAVQAFVAGEPALTPVRPPGARWQLGRWLRLAAVVVALLVLLPVIVVGAPAYLLLLRLHERRDAPSSERPDPVRRAEIVAYEDRCAQNPFCAVAAVKPGWFRAVTLRAALSATGFLARNLYTHGSLTGLRSIHFFRLVVVDGERLMFGSTFDGSLEGYMDDFVYRIGRGLNLIFANAVGYPRTSYLVFGGAQREQEFKDYVHVHQLPIPVFYSAYPDLTAVCAENNAAIRAGLFGSLSAEQAASWLRRL
jgi:hypothetical protein